MMYSIYSNSGKLRNSALVAIRTSSNCNNAVSALASRTRDSASAVFTRTGKACIKTRCACALGFSSFNGSASPRTSWFTGTSTSARRCSTGSARRTWSRSTASSATGTVSTSASGIRCSSASFLSYCIPDVVCCSALCSCAHMTSTECVCLCAAQEHVPDLAKPLPRVGAHAEHAVPCGYQLRRLDHQVPVALAQHLPQLRPSQPQGVRRPQPSHVQLLGPTLDERPRLQCRAVHLFGIRYRYSHKICVVRFINMSTNLSVKH